MKVIECILIGTALSISAAGFSQKSEEGFSLSGKTDVPHSLRNHTRMGAVKGVPPDRVMGERMKDVGLQQRNDTVLEPNSLRNFTGGNEARRISQQQMGKGMHEIVPQKRGDTTLMPDRQRVNVYQAAGKQRKAIKQCLDSTVRADRKEVFSYDNDGYNTQTVVYAWDVNHWLKQYRYDYGYDAYDNVASEEEWYWDTYDGEWYGSWKDEYVYNAQGREMLYTTYNYNHPNWEKYYKRETDRNAAGRRILSADYYWNGTEWVGNYKYTRDYDAAGNRIMNANFYWDNTAEDWYENDRYEYAFDADENQIMYTYYYWNGTELVPTYKDTSVYNSAGDYLFYMEYSWDNVSKTWVEDYKEEYTYDANGYLTTYRAYEWDGTTWVLTQKGDGTLDAYGVLTYIGYNWDGGSNNWVEDYKSEYTLDAAGNYTLAAYYYWSGGKWVGYYKYEYAYDAAGNYTLEIYYSWDNGNDDWVEYSKSEYTYDAAGNETLSIYYRWNSGISDWVEYYKYEYAYDAADNNISYKRWDWNTSTSDWVLYYQDTSAYNANGDQIFSLYWYSSSNTWSGWKQDDVFDVNGNMVSSTNYDWEDATNTWVDYWDLQYDYDLSYARLELIIPVFYYDYDPLMNNMRLRESFSSSWYNYEMFYYWSSMTVSGPPTYAVTGTVTLRDGGSPLAGVTVNCSGGYAFGVTDASGEYRIVVDSGASVTLTPSMAGYRFFPVSIACNSVDSDMPNQDFEAINNTSIMYSITGTVTIAGSGSPLSGVTVSAAGGYPPAVTDASGGYRIDVDSAVSVTLTASLNGYSFSPASIPCNNVVSNLFNQDFKATEVGISDVETGRAPSVRIYPNPTNGKLSVVSSQLSEKGGEIKIYDVVGQVVGAYRIRPTEEETVIDISHLAAGLYFLKIDGKTVKVVKE